MDGWWNQRGQFTTWPCPHERHLSTQGWGSHGPLCRECKLIKIPVARGRALAMEGKCPRAPESSLSLRHAPGQALPSPDLRVFDKSEGWWTQESLGRVPLCSQIILALRFAINADKRKQKFQSQSQVKYIL